MFLAEAAQEAINWPTALVYIAIIAFGTVFTWLLFK